MRRAALCFAALAGLTFPALAQEVTATADVRDLQGNSLGTLNVMDMGTGVHISGALSGVAAGEHGIHIHEAGNCDAADKFESAGAHFNPTSHQHGSENPAGPHAGDLPNITGAGVAVGDTTQIDVMTEGVTLQEGDNSLFDSDGSAIVIHADADDYKTDPSGNSGDRIACGVIEAAP